jgi:hypothetical protein
MRSSIPGFGVNTAYEEHGASAASSLPFFAP